MSGPQGSDASKTCLRWSQTGPNQRGPRVGGAWRRAAVGPLPRWRSSPPASLCEQRRRQSGETTADFTDGRESRQREDAEAHEAAPPTGSEQVELAVDQLFLRQLGEVVLAEGVPAGHVGGVAARRAVAAALSRRRHTLRRHQGGSAGEAGDRDEDWAGKWAAAMMSSRVQNSDTVFHPTSSTLTLHPIPFKSRLKTILFRLDPSVSLLFHS